MKLKIISNGTNFGTRIVDSETGEALGGVQSVKWEVDVNNVLATATITLAMVPIELTTEKTSTFKKHR